MTDREPIPTFADKWDRLTFLLHSYRLFLSLSIIVVIGLLVWFKPQIDVPPEYVAAVGGFVIIGVPAIPAGFIIARWLRGFRAVNVYHVNAVDDVVRKYHVPPAVWDNKTVDGPDPWPVNEGDGWAVREFQYIEATGTLVVRGCWLRDAADDALMTDKTHMMEMHGFLLEAFQSVCRLRAKFSTMSVNIERQAINAVHEAQERGKTLERDAIKAIWDEATEELEDAIPDDNPELETIEDLEGYRTPDRPDLDRDQMTPDPNPNGENHE